MSTVSICPVCKMKVNKSNYRFEFQDQTYVFCSQQCLDRFNDNPHIYIGHPARPSPKQKNMQVLKKRALKFKVSISQQQSLTVVESLSKMMGVKKVEVEKNHVYITYDLLQVTEEQIEKEIENSGEILGQSMAEKLRRAFVHYLEDSELSNLEQVDHSHRH